MLTASSATKAKSAARAKYRFPSKDPSDNEVKDTRKNEEKVSDILRLWCQLLTDDEKEVWNSIAERDLTHTITLPSGLRTPKSIIDSEIKSFKTVDRKTKQEMLDKLTTAPELHGNTCAKNTQQQTGELANDPSSALRLDNDFLVNQAHLGTPCKTTVAKSDTDATSADIANMLAYCNKEVIRIRRTTTPQPRLQHILRSNSDLLFKYLLVLKHYRPLSKSLYSVLRKLVLLKPIAGKLIKKVISALVRNDFVEVNWTYKHTVDFNVHLANSGPLLSFYLNGHLTEGVLDTGSTFTLVPYKFWKTLKLNQSMLDTSTNFNINSASHCNKDAVLGQIVLTFKVCNEMGDSK